MSGGKLCVSVIEARKVLADTYVAPNFYVKLKISGSEFATEVAKGSLAPKFLKDIRMPVEAPDRDALRIELLQVGPKGDLIIGTDNLPISAISATGTVVHWFELRTPSKAVGAELCMVVRYLPPAANRSLSPSYAIVTREQRLRASQSLPPGSFLGDNSIPPPASQFQDKPSFAPGTPPSTYAEPATPTKQGEVKQLFQTPSPEPPPQHFAPTRELFAPQPHASHPSNDSTVSTSHPAMHAMTTSSVILSNGGQPVLMMEAPVVANVPRGSVSGGGNMVVNREMSGVGVKSVRRKKSKQGLQDAQVPLPLAIASGVLVGALVWLFKTRPSMYDGKDADTLCTVGACTTKEIQDKYLRERRKGGWM